LGTVSITGQDRLLALSGCSYYFGPVNMQYRFFEKANIGISEIGLGTWSMGNMWGPRNDPQALQTIHKAFERGINFIDTAYAYGNGHSESLIGRAIGEHKNRDKIFVATKVPPKDHRWPAKVGSRAEEIFPGSWIREITEKSLKHLATDHIDLQQLHVWAPNWLDQGDWLNELRKLKEEGKIRSIGISLNDHEPDTALEIVPSGMIDSVQVIYNLFDQTPEERLLTLCREHKVAVIVRVPFDEGGLTGTLTPATEFHKKDWRRYYFQGERLKETCERVKKFQSFLTNEIKSLPEFALRFCLSHPAVTTVIPGMRRPEHVEINCAVSDGHTLPPEVLKKLKAHAWSRNFYPS